MNAKKAKLARRAIRNSGKDPRETDYYTPIRDRQISFIPPIFAPIPDPWTLTNSCGRKRYKILKQFAKEL